MAERGDKKIATTTATPSRTTATIGTRSVFPLVAFFALAYALWLALTIASAFVYTWLFNNTGGSILFAAMLHAAIKRTPIRDYRPRKETDHVHGYPEPTSP